VEFWRNFNKYLIIMTEENTINSFGSATPTPFRFSEPRQKSIHDRLLRLVGPGAASFYKDACRHVQIKPTFESAAHLVAHLLREVESSLHDVLESITEQKSESTVCDTCGQETNSTTHSDKIKVISNKLKLPEEVTNTWIGLSGKKGLHKFAHRSGLSSTRQIDDDFNKFWIGMETVFSVVLDSLEACYIEILTKLDELATKQKPLKSDAKFFCSKIPNNYNTHYHFFNKLSSPDWLPLLEAESVFLEAPEPEQDIETGGIRHPLWPAAVYLEKMATVNPGLVVKILQKLKDTHNSNVKSNLLKITVLLPKENRLLLIDKVDSWLKSDHDFFQFSLVDPGISLMNKFIDDKEEDNAFKTAHSLLEILPDSSSVVIDLKYTSLRNPKTRLEHWYYNQFLEKDFKKLVELNPKRSFDFVCDLLLDYLKLQREGRKESEKGYFEDLSYISRPAIENHEQNHDRDDVENSLITTIRDTGLKIINEESNELPILVSNLEKRKWDIFHRIAIFFLSKSPESAKDLVARYLTDPSFFDNSHFKHEQAELMNKGFWVLKEEQQKTILDWINESGKVTERIERRKQDMTVSQEQERQYKEVWQRDQLSYIKDDLPEDWKNRYSELIKKYGEPEHPDFPAYMSTDWVGPTSDVNSQELVNMEIEKLVNLLKTWEPQNHPHGFGPTKEGLGRELAVAIKLKPEKFKDLPERFEGVDPTYVRSFIQTFHELAQNGFELNWPKIIALCYWVMKQPREIPGRLGKTMDQDPDWSWTRKAISSLISRGANNNSIPFELREKIWEILKPLTHDPDPTPESESKWEENSDDAYTEAINCTRGEALNAVVEYALWVHRNTKDLPEGKEKIKTGFEIMPEVKAVLNEHLDSNKDPSSAVRSIYGRFFPWLLLMDKKWTLENIKRIFPLGQFESRLYCAAWNTFMLYAPAYNDSFDVLKDQYCEAISNLGKIDKVRRRYIDRDKRVAEHLMLFYCRGRIELNDNLLKEFWTKANDKLRGHALGFIGRSLNSDNATIDQKLLERMETLWESRLSAAKSTGNKSEYVEEMSSFGWWFASGKFEERWSNERYLEALEIGKNIQSDYHVMERLVETVKTSPVEAVKILSKLVLTNQPGWVILGNRDEINTVLASALQSSESAAQQEAKDLINRLVARGNLDLSKLLAK